MNILYFDTIPSTNLYLKENYTKFNNLTIACAKHQTDGRGRLGRTWLDEDDLLLSILITKFLDNPTDYTLLIASVLVKVLKKYNKKVSIKWPNDIIVNDMKLAGILLESITNEKTQCVVIGIGLNCYTTNFPKDLLYKATSLTSNTKKFFTKDILLQEIAECFQETYKEYTNGDKKFIRYAQHHSYLNGKEIRYNYQGNDYVGIVRGIGENGNLLVTNNKSIIELTSGEVTLHNIYKK